MNLPLYGEGQYCKYFWIYCIFQRTDFMVLFLYLVQASSWEGAEGDCSLSPSSVTASKFSFQFCFSLFYLCLWYVWCMLEKFSSLFFLSCSSLGEQETRGIIPVKVLRHLLGNVFPLYVVVVLQVNLVKVPHTVASAGGSRLTVSSVCTSFMMWS